VSILTLCPSSLCVHPHFLSILTSAPHPSAVGKRGGCSLSCTPWVVLINTAYLEEILHDQVRHSSRSLTCVSLFLAPTSTGDEPARQPGASTAPALEPQASSQAQGPGDEGNELGAYTEIRGLEQFSELRSSIPGLVVLDVYTPASGSDGSSSVWGSVQGPPTIHIPIHELSGNAARELALAPGIVVVNGPDHRALQACLRLKRVYHAPRVFLYLTQT
jgi:hypothetical protein